MKNAIHESMNSPQALEALYRTNPVEFKRGFEEAFAQNPTVLILQVWHERLFFKDTRSDSLASSGWKLREVALVVVLALVAGTCARAPRWFVSREFEDYFYTRFLATIIVLPLAIFFWAQNRWSLRLSGTLLALFLAGSAFLSLLPDRPHSDTITLAYLHWPALSWSLLGVAYLGTRWRDPKARMEYIRYNGELLIYTTIILSGGMLLTALSLVLFSLIGLNIEDWYTNYVVVYGSVASPLVATLLITRVIGVKLKVASVLAKVFTPLFLATVAAFLVAMVVLSKSPYSDRNFLMGFNALLLVVLGLAVFSIAGRPAEQTKTLSDYMNLALVTITLLLDLVALSAIVFRLTSYGFSPNRIAVLGANLLAFGHLLGIVIYYLGFVRGRRPLAGVERWITGYLPAYSAWGALATFGFPLIFRLK